MITLNEVPDGIEEIIDAYGNPDSNGDFLLDTSWVDHNLAVFDLPFPMRLSWAPLRIARRFQAHKTVGLVMVDALREIRDYKGWQYLQDNDYDFYGGCFNFRLMRGINKLSAHAWGIAFDINPHLGPLGEPSYQPEFVVQAFARRRFVWGGEWARPDGMHFQACKGI